MAQRQFAEEVLEAHNKYRRKHGSPDMVLDANLSMQSQECAQDLISSNYIGASRFAQVGENIYVIQTSDVGYVPKGHEAVSQWYQQIENVIFGAEPTNNNGLNFTQLVWKDSKMLGVGIARSPNKYVIVCQYLPPGNVYGQYVANVLPESK